MIIDCHTHLGRNENMQARAIDLLRSMDDAGIDRSLVFAGSINGCPNLDLLKEVAPHADRLYPVVAVELTIEAQDPERTAHVIGQRLHHLLEDHPSIVAAKFYLGYEHVFPDDPRVYAAMRTITVHGKTAIFHTGDCYCKIRNAKLKYAHPLGIDDVATDFPDTRIVIAHMGYPWHRDAAEVCYKNPNVYADISGFVYGHFDAASQGHFGRVTTEFVEVAGGCERLLFGSDWPISDQSSYVSVARRELPFDMMQENILRAFSLGAP